MNRTVLLSAATIGLFAFGLCRVRSSVAEGPGPLPGTRLLEWAEHDDALADRMMDGAHRFVEREIARARERRRSYWHYDLSSDEAYGRSVSANRRRLQRILGMADRRRVPSAEFEYYGSESLPALLARSGDLSLRRVRWAVFAGVDSEGLEVRSSEVPTGYTLFISDADQTPEQTVGLEAGGQRWAARIKALAQSGQRIVIPTLISRRLYLGPNGDDPRLKKAGITCREWIYRQAFQMGRHLIGYELQKVFAAVDILRRTAPDVPIRVEGAGEGALLAFYAAASDPRIASATLHGYFGSRELAWQEPIDRNLFGLLRYFGDAEIASLIHPRSLTIYPAAHSHFEDSKGRVPPFERQQAMEERQRLPAAVRATVHLESKAPWDQPDAGQTLQWQREYSIPAESRYRSDARHDRLLRQLENYTQQLVRGAYDVRREFFLYRAEPRLRPGKWTTERRVPVLDPEPFIKATERYRQLFRDQLMGRFDVAPLDPHPRARKILESARWTAYDVVLDVYPDLFAWGVLVVPKDVRPGERRPVVVVQHGRNGLPRKTIDAHSTGYNDVAARLAERGFVTFAPHNLYRGEDRYRWLDRKANTIGCTLFSFIIDSHEQMLRWLKTLPFVDGRRIAFYGLSYGGETAVRVPAVLPDYCLSICSGDFNQWTRKIAAVDFPHGFMRSIEWEMPYWNLGSTFDYAEMAYLIFPRPFMVERGHHDLVSQDHWVAHEYAKVRWLYAQYGLSSKTRIEFFQGGHSMNAEGSFEFLEQLRRPGKR